MFIRSSSAAAILNRHRGVVGEANGTNCECVVQVLSLLDSFQACVSFQGLAYWTELMKPAKEMGLYIWIIRDTKELKVKRDTKIY